MRHDEKGSALGAVNLAQQLKHLLRGLGIQVARGLIGQHQQRVVHQRPRNRHPLLHAAGKLGRFLVQRTRQPHGGQQFARTLAVTGADHAVGHQGWQRHILQRAEGGQQMVELKHKAQLLAAQQGQLLIAELAGFHPLQLVAATAHALQQPQNVEQGTLARARRPHQRDELTRLHLQLHAMQNFCLVGQPHVVGLAHLLQMQQRRGG